MKDTTASRPGLCSKSAWLQHRRPTPSSELDLPPQDGHNGILVRYDDQHPGNRLALHGKILHPDLCRLLNSGVWRLCDTHQGCISSPKRRTDQGHSLGQSWLACRHSLTSLRHSPSTLVEVIEISRCRVSGSRLGRQRLLSGGRSRPRHQAQGPLPTDDQRTTHRGFRRLAIGLLSSQ